MIFKLFCVIIGHKYKRYEYAHTNSGSSHIRLTLSGYRYYIKCKRCKHIIVKSLLG